VVTGDEGASRPGKKDYCEACGRAEWGVFRRKGGAIWATSTMGITMQGGGNSKLSYPMLERRFKIGVKGPKGGEGLRPATVEIGGRPVVRMWGGAGKNEQTLGGGS